MIKYGKAAYDRFLIEKKDLIEPIKEHNLENLELKMKLYAGFSPVCKLIPIYNFTEYSPERSKEIGYEFKLEYIDVLIEYKNTYLKAYRSHYTDKTFLFSLYHEIEHNYLYYLNLAKYNLDIPPQKVAKATVSKMDEWLNYLLKIEEARKECIKEITQKVQDFRDKLKPLEKEISWDRDREAGSLERGKLIYTFSINYNGSIFEKIDLDYNASKLEDFLAVSDNKFYRQSPSQKDIINSAIMNIAADMAEKSISDKFNLLPARLYDEKSFNEKFRRYLSFLYEKNYHFLSKLANLDYEP